MLVLGCLVLLQGDAAVEQALKAFREEMRSPSTQKRIDAIHALEAVPHTKTLNVLTQLLTTDLPTIRIAASKALSTFADHKKPDLVHASSRSSVSPVRVSKADPYA